MLFRTLSRFSAAPTTSGTVHEAAERGSIDALQRHLNIARELGYPDKDTLTRPDTLLGAFPLHFAAENGRMNVLEVVFGVVPLQPVVCDRWRLRPEQLPLAFPLMINLLSDLLA